MFITTKTWSASTLTGSFNIAFHRYKLMYQTSKCTWILCWKLNRDPFCNLISNYRCHTKCIQRQTPNIFKTCLHLYTKNNNSLLFLCKHGNKWPPTIHWGPQLMLCGVVGLDMRLLCTFSIFRNIRLLAAAIHKALIQPQSMMSFCGLL